MRPRTARSNSRTRYRRAQGRGFDHGQPISRIDTRPMVIFLVAVFAFILLFVRYPAHAVVIELWDGNTVGPIMEQRAAARNTEDVPTNRLILTEDDMMLWNGQLIDQPVLYSLLQELQTFETQPILEFEPEANASYDLTLQIMHMIVSSGADFRIAGTEEHCNFESDWAWNTTSATGRLALLSSNAIPPPVVDFSVYPSEPAIESEVVEPFPVIEPYHEMSGTRDCEPRFIVHEPR